MPVAKPEPADRITVKDSLEKYEDYVRYHRSLRTYQTYRPILRSFAEVCPHAYIDEIERPALIDFATMCLKKGLSGKTIYNMRRRPDVQEVRGAFQRNELKSRNTRYQKLFLALAGLSRK